MIVVRTDYSIASRIPPGRVEEHGDMKGVIANRVSMCTLELNDMVLVFDVVVMQKYAVVLRIQNLAACVVGIEV